MDVFVDLVPGQRFRVWYYREWNWVSEVREGKRYLSHKDIEIDEEDAAAALAGTSLDYEVIVPPRPSDMVGEVRLTRNGRRSVYVFTTTGIHAVQKL